MTDGVDGRTDQEWGFSANPVKQEEGYDGSDALGNIDHTTHCKLHFVVQAQLLEEDGRIVDELSNEVSKSIPRPFMLGGSRH